LWQELEPHEIGFLILLAAAAYACQDKFWRTGWPVYVYSAALLAAVPVLLWRCREEWRQLPNRGFFLALAAAWVALFATLGNATFNAKDFTSLPAWLFDIYTSPSQDEGHGLLIPFVVLGLYGWRRKELLAEPPRLWWPAILLVAFALLLHFVGFLSQQQRISTVGFLLGLYALTGLAWGKAWLQRSFFPFFLLGFCVPIGQYSGTLTLPLRLLVSRIVEVIAHVGLAPDLVREGTQLFDAQHTFAYEVAAPCSGIHSLIALLALATIYGFMMFKPIWKRLVMMLVAVPFAVLGNVVRLCFTIAVAETCGQAGGKLVETNAGYLTFAVAIGGAYLVARRLERIGTAPAPGAGLGPTLADKPATP
jgi:exosortase